MATAGSLRTQVVGPVVIFKLSDRPLCLDCATERWPVASATSSFTPRGSPNAVALTGNKSKSLTLQMKLVPSREKVEVAQKSDGLGYFQ